ncbi:expressed unknown protein [Seminavis robusta]|uniref:Uncharacterized protein n=1 Tax=Seminavis robusta TaxID=568900 RepID=A0A9N8H242_9STRA|nr:expressed unknown protein [Seminavis robusta]|eukprot:Sro3_g002760.1 n/a (308) ;mRNA; f:236706-237629
MAQDTSGGDNVMDSSDTSSMETDDPEGMTVSPQEHAWALEIKTAAETPNSGFRPISDFEYAQYALVTRGRLNEALARIRKIQSFQAQYQVDNTPSQGVSIVEQFRHLQPTALLNLDKHPDTGDSIICFDRSTYFPAITKAPSPDHTDPEHNWKIDILFWYYALRTVQPDFHTIRHGVVFLFEAMGLGKDNVDVSLAKRLHREMWAYYPFEIQRTRIYNANQSVPLLVSALQSLLRPEELQCIETGCTVHGDDDDGFHQSTDRATNSPPLTLGDIYLQPTVDQSGRYLLARIMELLTLRSQNEESFRL